MADPTKYTPAYSYSGWQATNPTRPLPADEVDNDFANVSRSVNQTIDALKDVRRSDGKLKNQSVGPDQLSPALTIGFTFTGTWIDGHSYSAGDGVVKDDTFYSARIAHTADVSNAPGNTAYWNELFSLNDIVVTGGMSLPRDSFVGDGVTKDFTLSFTPLSKFNLFVQVGGVIQGTDAYSSNGNTLTFINPPPNGYGVEVRGFATVSALVTPEDGSVTTVKLADLSVTEAKLAAAVATKLNGAAQKAQNLADLADLASARLNLKVPSYVADRTALKALDTTKDTVAYFDGSLWKWTTGDYSTLIAADTQEGVHVKANAIAAASGAWVRQVDILQPEMFQALGGSNDDHTAVQAAWDMGATLKKMVLHSQPLRAGDELKTSSDLHVRFINGAWLRQTGFSSTGSFITNLRNSSSAAASIQSNILFENPQIDGSLYPTPIELETASSTANTVTFTAAASAVDDFYVGFALEDTTGANGAGLRIVTDYVGSTRTATFATAWASNPVAGTKILAGWNDNAFGFAAGVSNVTVRGGYIKNYPANIMVPSATGGKGVNFEQGVTNGLIIGVTVENCGTGLFVQGLDGSFANGAKKRAVAIQLIGNATKNCGSAITIAGVNGSADPDGDSDDSMIVVDSHVYENCGHSPYRLISSGQQKSGIINLLEAQNVSISNIRGRNDSTYPGTSPGYPTDYAARCGFGLSSNVGAMIWGWGRNIKVNGYVHHGNIDVMIAVRRGRALGDDAGSSGAPENCFNWSLAGLEIHGVTNEYVIRIDPTAGNRVVAAELTGEIEAAVNGSFLTSGIVDTNMSSFGSITLAARDHNGGKTAIGTPAQINTGGNTFASFGSGRTDLRKVDRVVTSLQVAKTQTISDDSVFSWAVPSGVSAFELIIHQAGGSARGHLAYLNGAWNIIAQTSTLIETSTSVLTGTTGTDTKVTVSFNSGTIYVENRLGAAYTPYILPHYYG